MFLLHRLCTEILLTSYFVMKNIFYNLKISTVSEATVSLIFPPVHEKLYWQTKWLGLLVKQSRNTDLAQVMEKHTLKIDLRLCKADFKEVSS